MEKNLRHINPVGLKKSSAFSHVVITHGPGKTIYVGGQNSVDANGNLIGAGDIKAQTEQVMQNLQAALKASGATFEHLVKLNVNIVEGQSAYEAFLTSQKYIDPEVPQPAITVLFVAGLANPEYLVEIDAVAFIADR